MDAGRFIETVERHLGGVFYETCLDQAVAGVTGQLAYDGVREAARVGQGRFCGAPGCDRGLGTVDHAKNGCREPVCPRTAHAPPY